MQERELTPDIPEHIWSAVRDFMERSHWDIICAYRDWHPKSRMESLKMYCDWYFACHGEPDDLTDDFPKM